MKNEYDLKNELGPVNWLDSVAGEAYFLGEAINDPELVMRGTALLAKILEIPYNCDRFSEVIAIGMDLEHRVRLAKDLQSSAVFLDEVAVYEGKNKTLGDWEYDLIMAGGRYQINMIMPEYYGKWPGDTRVDDVCEEAKKTYKDAWGSFSKKEWSEMMECQKMDVVEFCEGEKIIFRQVDFNHECGYKRGQLRIFYFDDHAQAMEAWKTVRPILSRKK